MVLTGTKEPLGHGSLGDRNAKRRRSLRGGARGASNRCALNDVYCVAGAAPDDPQYVQDCRRTYLDGLPCLGAHHGCAGAVHFRRPQRCHGYPLHRMGDADLQQVQEVMDMALIAQAATLESRVPFLHFFDGFRTSHEVMKIEQLADDDLRAMVNDELIRAHRARALSPDHPVMRGTAQNPMCTSRGAKRSIPFTSLCQASSRKRHGQVRQNCCRTQYKIVPILWSADADRVIVIMGSGAEAAEEAVDFMNAKGEKVGLLKVHLYRPFSGAFHGRHARFREIDRRPRSHEGTRRRWRTALPRCDHGLARRPFEGNGVSRASRRSSADATDCQKEFTPAMVKAVFDEMKKPSRRITSPWASMTMLRIPASQYDPNFGDGPRDLSAALFYGLGSDGTVGANKNSIKIIGEETEN
jgi:pyruvate-ferredoxin/flavodoxin oxidoreductase